MTLWKFDMKLIFVYNADSGKLNALMDVAHKMFKPETYTCSLCALTYDTFTEKKAWKAFRERTSIQMDFYHKDEFEATFKDQMNTSFKYPVILKETAKPETLINAGELATVSSVEELIDQIEKRVKG